MDLIVFERLVGKDNMPGAIKRLQQRNTSVWTKGIAADDGHQKKLCADTAMALDSLSKSRAAPFRAKTLSCWHQYLDECPP